MQTARSLASATCYRDIRRALSILDSLKQRAVDADVGTEHGRHDPLAVDRKRQRGRRSGAGGKGLAVESDRRRTARPPGIPRRGGTVGGGDRGGDGIDPPKVHDVGDLVLRYADRLAAVSSEDLASLAHASKELRKEREFSLYGDIDFIPTDEYDRGDADVALAQARLAEDCLGRLIGG